MSQLRKYAPQGLINFYHKTLAVLANVYYGWPSEKLIVIGVTGTNGKTSTCEFIAKILEEDGYKVGLASTAVFKIAGKEWLNDKKMTMLGRFALQKMLRQMVDAGCKYAVIETSSQGVEQFRHLGIHYDICVFTNLTPEHIEAHGGFENYKTAKLKLFKHLERQKNKKLKNLKIKKVIVVNGDDKYALEFLDFKVDEKIAYYLNHEPCLPAGRSRIMNHGSELMDKLSTIIADGVEYLPGGLRFNIDDEIFNLKLFGRFNVYNSLAAIAVARSQDIDLAVCQKALEKIVSVPGRMEFIETDKDFKVLVDYAPEPESLKQLFETIELHHLVPPNGRIIHVFGSCGGGRDIARRPIMGELSAKQTAIQIITNEDPYDDDPREIIDAVADGALKAGRMLNENLFKIIDRREAIKFALSLARSGDLVLLTGKGCEQAICVKNGCKIKWDEREVVREELKKLI